MKYTVMKCECCGKIFHSEYYEGGYIDHVENFSKQFDIIDTKGAVGIMREIAFDGNSYRDAYDVRNRFQCYAKHCERTGRTDALKEVRKLIEEHLIHLEELEALRAEIKKLAKDLGLADKEYLKLDRGGY